jgi:N utilization substance protein A
VDIRSETEFAAEEAEHGYEEEEVQGRCAAILSNGRRCPNAALPGSRYCGLELHQALADIDGDRVADLTPSGSADDAPAGDRASAAESTQPAPAAEPAEEPPAERLAGEQTPSADGDGDEQVRARAAQEAAEGQAT